MKRSIFLCLAAAICFLWNCECEDLTPTVVEEFPDPFLEVESGLSTAVFANNLPVFFQMNKPIDTSTVGVGTSVVFEGLDDLSFDFSSGRDLYFTGSITGCTPNNFPCNGTVTITLKGTGESVIRSMDGQVLDGNKDGSDGGDFVKTFEF